MLNLSNYHRVHFIGIGGIGMSALAEILLARGFKVTGSDMKESQITDHLASMGAKIIIGHKAENVEGADLVIYTAAISETNPEAQRAKELGIPLAPRAELLGTLMNEVTNSIAVSGTHGKTTTTSMIALILENAKFDPTIFVGGELPAIGGNVKVGKGDYFVAEACEYRDSFLNLRPRIEIILNIDSDHLDYFKDVQSIEKSFEKFASYIPEGGTLIAYDANPFVSQIVQKHPNAITYGYSSNSDYWASDIHFDNGMPIFQVHHGDENLGEVRLQIPGEHNILNSLAAFACTHMLGADPKVIIETLDSYRGTERRFDVKGTFGPGVKLVDDYAHHPTEIEATLAAADNIPHKKLWVLFQPHTYTRTLALFDRFTDAFEKADMVILADIYAAREKDIYNISSEKLADAIREKHPDKPVMYMKSFEEIADYVYQHAEKGDLVLTVGAGDIYKVGDLILKKDEA
ncbi:MAG: UDP-N-acetylmuramate--L-alanine ligase [Eubacteriales bacterium]|nr:UDP-N-acetylmuramate--L-alanine ligase [Eubacteriales bacterium]